ncbi:hypothetical protein [Paenibacillus lautus]
MSKVDLTANINTVSLGIQTGCTLEQFSGLTASVLVMVLFCRNGIQQRL